LKIASTEVWGTWWPSCVTMTFLTFSKNPQISNFIRIYPVGGELFHVDGWIDRHDKPIVTFHNFSNVPKNSSLCKTNLVKIFDTYMQYRNQNMIYFPSNTDFYNSTCMNTSEDCYLYSTSNNCPWICWYNDKVCTLIHGV
jgi:hypothetical protein